MKLIMTLLFFVVFVFLVGSAMPFKCPRSKGLFADPKSCRRFYECFENRPFQKYCPPSLYFDDIQKDCVPKSKDLVCGPVPTRSVVPAAVDPLRSPKCDKSRCKLPNCYCSRSIPGDLSPKVVPMMVTITFDGTLNQQNAEFHQRIIQAIRNNPNGNPATVTFFVSHDHSKYNIIQKMAAAGHEIALNGIYYREPETWWETATKDELKEQFDGLRKMLVKFAGLRNDSIVGMRSPFLRNGGNTMAAMIEELGLTYDSSLTVDRRVPIWPYTLDYRIPHRCVSGRKCPTRSFKGVWEYPLNTLHSENAINGRCAYADQCDFEPYEDLIYGSLLENFYRHYKTNKAPFGLYFDFNWFQSPKKVAALIRFIENVQYFHKDVWFVSIKQAIKWTMNPLPTRSNHPAFKFEKDLPESCEYGWYCKLKHVLDNGDEEMRYLETCAGCPDSYPWVGNPEGLPLNTEVPPQNEIDKVAEEEEYEDVFPQY